MSQKFKIRGKKLLNVALKGKLLLNVVLKGKTTLIKGLVLLLSFKVDI